MRNLRVTHYHAYRPELRTPLTGCCWDTETDSVICAYGPSDSDTLVELKRWHDQSKDGITEPSLIASWDAPCPLPDFSCDQILNVQFFRDVSTICLVFAGGDIVLVREKPPDHEDKIEIVGSIDNGITAAAWSPDEEVLVICSRNDTVLFMTRDFDSTESTNLSPDDLKASKHVSVGWGKSETQFKGKGAKALRDPTVPEKVDEGLPSGREDGITTISWRGDGQYVAINSTQQSNRRVIRVFTRDGALDGVSEPMNSLESALSWRPAGNIIASVQRSDDSIQIVFFERNGLRHGQFPLPLAQTEKESWASKISLSWNNNSTVLAVGLLDRVQLWTMDNYHYYLKQELRVTHSVPTQCPLISWHPEEPLSLTVSVQTSNIHRFGLASCIAHDDTTSIGSHGAVAVVDGSHLKLTPMRYSNIPPPMSLHEIDVHGPLVDVSFYNYDARNLTIAALTTSSLYIYDWQATNNTAYPVIRSRTELGVDRKESDMCRVFQQVIFTASDKVLILCSRGEQCTILEVSIGDSVTEVTCKDIERWTQALAVCPGVSDSFIEVSQDGLVKRHSNQDKSKSRTRNGVVSNEASPGILGSIAAPMEHCEAVTLDAVEDHISDFSSKPIAVTLTNNGQLNANTRRLASNCTSFLVTSAHIIFTTAQNLLKFIHLTQLQDLEVPPDAPETDERCRAVERGARLVTVIPATSALVLQMPRGNLETIYPRALVLAEIRRAIGKKQYLKAFKVCRTHRVDMNIIHDYNPPQFITDVPLFIEQVRRVEYIDLFLSQLRDEDVALTLYKETSKKTLHAQTNVQRNHTNATSTVTVGKSKVNCVCDAFLKALRPLASTNLQNLITSYVCKVPPDLDSGLKEVSKLQKEDSEQAQLAVEHICFLVDVNRLFDAALGLYDIKLALLVAQQAQKDPREYLPFLQQLSEYEPLRMKFEIDDHLGRYALCLKHLTELDVFDEFKAFMVKHEFYGEALLLYRYQEPKIRDIMKLHAEYLTTKSRHEEAGTAYEYLQDYKAACESYRLAQAWREALGCANAVPLSQQEVDSLACSLAEGLVELKDYHAAATVTIEYLKDPKGAAQLFCKGHYFTDAVRILNLHGKQDLVESVVDAGLIEAMASTTEMLAECKSQLNAQVPRIRDLRSKKDEDPLSFYDADVNGGAEVPDNVSLAGTDASTVGSTLFTRYTNRSGTIGTNATRKTHKNKRREERKRAQGKKGSVYEEEYLVNSVGRLVDRVNSIGDEVSRLVSGLVRRRMIERARAVETAMLGIVNQCLECIPEVFDVNAHPTAKSTVRALNGHELDDGNEVVPEDNNLNEEMKCRPAPVVKPYVGLKLLAGNI